MKKCLCPIILFLCAVLLTGCAGPTGVTSKTEPPRSSNSLPFPPNPAFIRSGSTLSLLTRLRSTISPDSRTRIIAFANPSNPIGTAISSKDMYNFLKKVPKETLVVIDEAYNEFNRGDDSFEDTAKWLDEFENLIVSRTFSKAYGLAGLRVGYMLANPEITSILNRLRAPFNVNIAALAAACAALDDKEFLDKTVENNTRERLRYAEFCKKNSLFMIPSFANFVAIDFKDYDASAIAERLLHMGVIVRPLLGYKLKTILRISIGTPQENDRFFECVETILKDMKN